MTCQVTASTISWSLRPISCDRCVALMSQAGSTAFSQLCDAEAGKIPTCQKCHGSPNLATRGRLRKVGNRS